MLGRWPWLSLFALLACVRDVENHCANQDAPAPDQYCANISDVGEFCSKCTTKDYGCVADLSTIEPDCRPDGATSVADDGSTDDSSTMPVTDTTTGDDTTGSAMTTEADGSSSSGDTGIPEPECGNGIVEDENNENCDGDELGPVTTCRQVGLGDGQLSCNSPDHPSDPCKYNLDDCEDTVTSCGDQMIEGTEQCEPGVPLAQTCESISEMFIGGELACTECMYNTTPCDLCKPDGATCETTAECCQGLCVDLLGKTCKL